MNKPQTIQDFSESLTSSFQSEAGKQEYKDHVRKVNTSVSSIADELKATMSNSINFSNSIEKEILSSLKKN